ncbi:MAG: pyridoxal-phosphate dependent enzyme, partial [Acidimicrobiia bacterium]|nr:pyridoxal-phosphate dependent enzyme [Acidimicrobiia bacterium]
MSASLLELDQIDAAARTIADVAVITPVRRSAALDRLCGAALLIKDESRQRSGSFKFRGAYNRLAAIPTSDRGRGVVAVSSGNHGAAVATAAALLDMPCVVHVPANVAPAKRAKMLTAGTELVTFDPSTADREGPAIEEAARRGATFVHPFEDRLVMAGQGTCALELHH